LLGDSSVGTAEVYGPGSRQALVEASSGEWVREIPLERKQRFYLIVLHGHFVCRSCSRPAAAMSPRGTIATVVWSRAQGGTDFGLVDRLPASMSRLPAPTVIRVPVAGMDARGTPTAVGAGRVPAFSGCASTGQVIRPRTIVFACADHNFYVDRLHWLSWTARSASGIGVGHQNDCTPYCAAGHFHAYPNVSIRLRRPETCTRGRRLFTRIGCGAL
jgi:hypothetical protein